MEVIQNKSHKALTRTSQLKHNIIKELFDLAQAWHWRTPSQMLREVEPDELSAMFAHARLRSIMQAIEYEDTRPKEKPKGRR